MSQIIWLASYPKSGNTWLRVFLANLLSDGTTPVDINAIETSQSASRRDSFDEALGVECSDLTAAEIDHYRPSAYRQMAGQSANNLFLKIHDAYTMGADGEPLVPADVTRAAVYIVRNPLDVAISGAYHSGISTDESIQRMGEVDRCIASNLRHLDGQLPQRLLSWSLHVLSWLDQKAISLHLMRYEDMLSQPLHVFFDLVRFLGLPDDTDRVVRALKFSSFERLQQQEELVGFRERPVTASAAFFRQGKAGNWRELLTPEQTRRIIADHGQVMHRLGYLESTESL